MGGHSSFMVPQCTVHEHSPSPSEWPFGTVPLSPSKSFWAAGAKERHLQNDMEEEGQAAPKLREGSLAQAAFKIWCCDPPLAMLLLQSAPNLPIWDTKTFKIRQYFLQIVDSATTEPKADI